MGRIPRFRTFYLTSAKTDVASIRVRDSELFYYASLIRAMIGQRGSSDVPEPISTIATSCGSQKIGQPAQRQGGSYRAQARRLREKLEGYLSEHPDFSLKRIQLSGSLAKGTALRSLNDIDTWLCTSAGPTHLAISAHCWTIWQSGLRNAFPTSRSGQTADLFSHPYRFRGSGLDARMPDYPIGAAT